MFGVLFHLHERVGITSYRTVQVSCTPVQLVVILGLPQRKAYESTQDHWKMSEIGPHCQKTDVNQERSVLSTTH